MALFYDAGRLALEEAGDFWLSDTPGVPASASWGNDLPRILTWARFRDLRSGVSFSVANTHFDHRSEVARTRSALLVAAALPDAVLLGDFNAEPGSEVHRILLRHGWVDAHAAHADASDAAPTFHGWTGKAWMRIDWILAPPGMRVVSHGVVRDRPEGRFPSDHDAVVADVELAAGATLVPDAPGLREGLAPGLPR